MAPSYSQQLGEQVTNLLLRARDAIDHPDPETAVRAAFNAVFSALILRSRLRPGIRHTRYATSRPSWRR